VRRAVPFAILAGCLGVGVLPALAADTVVSAGSSFWDQSEFAVQPGDTVTWVNNSGVAHNLSVDGAKVVQDSSSWTYADSYPARAGAYAYRCSLHAGMTGRFYVNATGTVPAPSPTASPSPSATPTRTATPSPSPASTAGPGGGTATPAPGSATAPPAGSAPAVSVTSFRARAARGRFCTRRSARCRRPGVFLLLDLGAPQPVRVRGTLRRGSRRVRAVSLLARPGNRRVRLPGPRLRAGRYALTLRAGSIARTVRFRVRSA